MLNATKGWLMRLRDGSDNETGTLEQVIFQGGNW